MLVDDAEDCGETEAGALARAFGGEKWLEYAGYDVLGNGFAAVETAAKASSIQ